MTQQNTIYGVTPMREIAGLSGLAFLEAIRDGRLPAATICKGLNYALTLVEPGRAIFEGEPSAEHLNPVGTVHGGWAATLLDSAMACAVHSLVKQGQLYTSLEMKVHFTRPILPGMGVLSCEGRIVHNGGRVATSEGFLRDREGKLLAHGTETCLIFDAPRN